MFKLSLSRRILLAFVLMTALVGGIFAFGIIEVVHQVEESLLSRELGKDLRRLLQVENMEEWRQPPEPEQLFYFSGGRGEFALPDDLQQLSEGFHELERGGQWFHVFVQQVDGQRYALLQDQSEFEAREQLLTMVVLAGFMLSLGLSGLLGWLLARKVIEPVVRLAAQVAEPVQRLDSAPALATGYAADEVGQLATAFDASLGRLREALQRERLFTSDVSHELRTPLMVLASSCELLLEDARLDCRARQRVERMALVLEEMHTLVQTFLLLARDQPASLEVPGASLQQVAERLLQEWRPQVEAKGLQLEYRLQGEDRQPYNALLLRTVMDNLLRNALHYTEHGSIRLQLQDGGFCLYDSGPGIADGERDAIFQPFVRGQAARGEGLGLGLSLVRRICERQGWTIELQPVEPSGCCFQVRLHE